MSCDLENVNSAENQQKRFEALAKLIASLAEGRASVVLGADGAVAIAGWAEQDRNGMLDGCAVRELLSQGCMELQVAIAQAELQAGVKLNLQANGGSHSHDGGKTWHPGH